MRIAAAPLPLIGLFTLILIASGITMFMDGRRAPRPSGE
jgi:hypothetical protein